MTKTCFDCGKTLSWTGSGPGWMNREQWDAVKAGDYFAKCDTSTRGNGNCYFRDTPGLPVLRRLPDPLTSTQSQEPKK